MAAVGGEFLVLEIFADLGQAVEVFRLVGIFLDDQHLLALGKFLVMVLGVGLGGGGGGVFFRLADLQHGVILQLFLDPLLQRHQRQL